MVVAQTWPVLIISHPCTSPNPGILNLASAIVDLMAHFFPNSFDRLERDQGLFHGPSPVLLESCSFSDLAMLLCGNKRKTSEIEFGAHQVSQNNPGEKKLGLKVP